jgi:5'-nucleotidase
VTAAAGTRVLVTNDDGVEAEGLRHLAAYARDLGMRVLVAAPRNDTSGCGTSRSVAPDGLVQTRTLQLPGLDGVPVHAVAAPPALIVIAACQGAFGAAPDMVLAGINPGANLGPGVLHSGTVGAALTAAHHHLPAVALSICYGERYHWQTALVALSVVLPAVLAGRRDGPPLILNANVPNVPPDELLGVRQTGLASQSDVRFTVRRVTPGLLCASHQEQAPCLEGDSAVLAAGYATVTALGPLAEDTDAVLALLDSGQMPDSPVAGDLR